MIRRDGEPSEAAFEQISAEIRQEKHAVNFAKAVLNRELPDGRRRNIYTILLV